MKKTACTVLAVWLALLAPGQRADGATGQGTGSIEGRVQNDVTGRYLNNSRVAVKGTGLRVYTDESGRYRITNVPSGRVILEVVYSGLETREVPLDVPAGQAVVRDVKLVPPGGSTVKLDPFVVDASRTMDQSIIAINEQRFAPNIKTVVSTGDLSEQVDGNIAEFLKFVPGISTDNDQRPGGSTISVRGFPSNLTQVNLDGAETADAPLGGTTRSVSTRMTMSIANLARVEVTKVPTPATGADTMAGSVNLVSRSAFESPRRQFRYTLTLSGEHTDILDLFQGKKTYSLWDDEKIFYAAPSFSFTHTHPVSENFGYTLSGMYDIKRLTNKGRSKAYNFNSSTYAASPENPLFLQSLDTWGGQTGERRHLGATMDWRVTPNSILSAGTQIFNSMNYNGNYRIAWNTGSNANPTVVGGVAGSHGPEQTIGATGRGRVQFANNTQVQLYKGARGNLRYLFNNGDWRIDLKTSLSAGSMRYRTMPDRGHIRNLTVRTDIPVRVELLDIDPVSGPRTIQVFDNNEQMLDYTTADFLRDHTEILSATALTHDVADEVSTYNADIRRELDLFSFPAAVQFGAASKSKERDFWNRNQFVFRYNGPGGDQSPAPFLTPPLEIFPGGDGQQQVAVSPYLAAQAWNNDPGLFYEEPRDRVNRERTRRQRSERIKETVDAYYFQAEARFLDNRLNVLTGVRYENTAGRGMGALNTPDAVWQRTTDGSFVLDDDGDRVRNPEAGAPNSLEELDFIWHERASRSNRTYDGFYPSVHLTYSITNRLQARAAYAKTYGRPNFTFIIPNTVVNEFEGEDGNVTGGRLTVRNPGLLPWTADNYDLTLEYYTDGGGVFGANVFRKNVTDFFGSITRDATAAELAEVGVTNPVGEWELRTTMNVGDAQIDGVELNFNQSLAPIDEWLAGWGNNFRVFGNITKIDVEGDRTADFSGFLPTSANWGFQFARKRVGASFKWNYSSDRPTGLRNELGANGERFNIAQTHMDVNLSYSLRPNLAIFLHMRNVTRKFREQSQRSDVLPEYARVRNNVRWEGIATNFGIKGSF